MSNGKSVDEENGKKSTSNIKSAANLLLKGGTLLSDSCAKCKGVQVRYKDETICVSCGRKIKETTNQDIIKQQQQQQIENEQQEQHHSIPDSNLSKKKEFKGPTVFDYSISNTMYTKLINDKINFLLTTLENENDILIQYTKLDLISKYLEVLDKLKIISNKNNSNKQS
ncbi:MAG TPA: autoantigen p27 domain-containing protein [Nitrososphaeraceae archaeon]|nr:autoantigen p27 domain-containing protein [Nitrososphaeraceae archaeon]